MKHDTQFGGEPRPHAALGLHANIRRQVDAGMPPPDARAVRRQRLLITLDQIEAIFGLVINSFVVVVILGIGAAVLLVNAWVTQHPYFELPTRIMLTIGWLIVLIFGALSLRPLGSALQSGAWPAVLRAAERCLRRSWPLRVPVAAWWVLFALTAPVVAHSIVAHITASPGNVVVGGTVSLVILFAASVAMNSNFLIAVATLTGSPSILRDVWRVRFLIDLALAIAIYTINPRGIDVDSLLR